MLDRPDGETDTGLRERDRRIVEEVLRTEDAVERARLFGSRARGTHRPHSDIDLVIEGAGVGLRTALRLKDRFEESTLPVPVDVVRITPDTEPAFARNVDRWGRVIYERSAASAPAREASTLPG